MLGLLKLMSGNSTELLYDSDFHYLKSLEILHYDSMSPVTKITSILGAFIVMVATVIR